jgi:hypothetical protein
VTFTVGPSRSRGYVRVAREDPRFLETDDGRPFFAVGQNVAFIKDVGETRRILGKLAANGVNYVRVWTCCEDWGMAIEARKSVWARSWDWKPPLAPDPRGGQCVRIGGGPGASVTANPTQRMGLLPGTRYRLAATVWSDVATDLEVEVAGERCRWSVGPQRRRVTFDFAAGPDDWWIETIRFALPTGGVAYLSGLSLVRADTGRELLWDADPDRQVLGVYNQADCAMLDAVVTEAERLGVRLQLCLLTRDLYMDRLKGERSPDYDRATADARNLLRYAIARWGCSTAVAVWEYWNEMDPGRPTSRFYADLGRYLDGTDPYRHLRTTSAWSDATDDWRHPALDVANMHWYLRPAEGDLYRDEVEAVLRKCRALRASAPARPAMFAEFGLAQDNWQPSPDMGRDARYTHLHRALWASALSGLSGTVMAWWWEDIHARDAYSVYRGVSRFVARIPWTSARLRPVEPAASGARCRAIGLASRDRAYIWVADRESSWYRTAVEARTPETLGGITVTLTGMAAAAYRADWTDTRTGERIRADKVTSVTGTLVLSAPPFAGDIACAIERMQPTRSSGGPR